MNKSPDDVMNYAPTIVVILEDNYGAFDYKKEIEYGWVARGFSDVFNDRTN